MSLYFAWSSFNPKWVEIREGEEVLAEVEVSFPLRKLPSTLFPTLEEAHSWLSQKERRMAKSLAVWYLARQSLASTILYQKLQAKGYSEDVCSAVSVSCQSYCSDDEYWSRVVEKELIRGYGPRWIAWKWKAKGLPDHFVKIVATPARQSEVIRRLAGKHKDQKKAFRYFLQRGFDLDIVREVLSGG